MDKHEAIYALHSNVVSIRDDAAYDESGNQVAYDHAAVEAEINANAYKAKRLTEYPSIGDQLDALFHAGVFPDDMAAQIQAVKDKYPKG